MEKDEINDIPEVQSLRKIKEKKDKRMFTDIVFYLYNILQLFILLWFSQSLTLFLIAPATQILGVFLFRKRIYRKAFGFGSIIGVMPMTIALSGTDRLDIVLITLAVGILVGNLATFWFNRREK